MPGWLSRVGCIPAPPLLGARPSHDRAVTRPRSPMGEPVDDKDLDRVETSGGSMGGGGLEAGLSGRYASALFDLARDQKSIDTVERSLTTVRDAREQSADFRALTITPTVSRGDAVKGVLAVADSLGIDGTTRNFLGVLAENRRLGQIPRIVAAFRRLASRHRGEATAEVVSAHPLSPDQVGELKQQLRTRVGREVAVDLRVDPNLLGGLVVKVGSQMIDSSIRTRLNALSSAMKG
jgi:F-type H+-transporting ATPase subunit delta